MRRVLVKVQEKSVVLNLKQFGDVEVVSSVFNIYAMTIDDEEVSLIRDIAGVLSIEEDEFFELQKTN